MNVVMGGGSGNVDDPSGGQRMRDQAVQEGPGVPVQSPVPKGDVLRVCPASGASPGARAPQMELSNRGKGFHHPVVPPDFHRLETESQGEG